MKKITLFLIVLLGSFSLMGCESDLSYNIGEENTSKETESETESETETETETETKNEEGNETESEAETETKNEEGKQIFQGEPLDVSGKLNITIPINLNEELANCTGFIEGTNKYWECEYINGSIWSGGVNEDLGWYKEVNVDTENVEQNQINLVTWGSLNLNQNAYANSPQNRYRTLSANSGGVEDFESVLGDIEKIVCEEENVKCQFSDGDTVQETWSQGYSIGTSERISIGFSGDPNNIISMDLWGDTPPENGNCEIEDLGDGVEKWVCVFDDGSVLEKTASATSGSYIYEYIDENGEQQYAGGSFGSSSSASASSLGISFGSSEGETQPVTDETETDTGKWSESGSSGGVTEGENADDATTEEEEETEKPKEPEWY